MSHEENGSLPELPETGFYYHHKHRPDGPVNNHAYEVFSVGYHTEDDRRDVDQYIVAYRPLYASFIYRLGKGKLHDNKPLAKFMAGVEKDGATTPRYTRITDETVLAELREIRKGMYPHLN